MYGWDDYFEVVFVGIVGVGDGEIVEWCVGDLCGVEWFEFVGGGVGGRYCCLDFFVGVWILDGDDCEIVVWCDC